jgi:hypothetical protein
MSALAAEITKNKRQKLKMSGRNLTPASMVLTIKGDAAEQIVSYVFRPKTRSDHEPPLVTPDLTAAVSNLLSGDTASVRINVVPT